MRQAYRAERESEVDFLYVVIGPDGVVTGSLDDKERAEDHAARLNSAYENGWNAATADCKRKLGEVTEEMRAIHAVMGGGEGI